MAPPPTGIHPRFPRLFYALSSFLVHHAPKHIFANGNGDINDYHLNKRDDHAHGGKLIAFAILIPVLVLLSGLFAGLTLGYMSLDETQLHVLSVSGSPKQKAYARKIQPIRKNGHLLLVTLLLANMIVNETLPVISDPVLGGGVPSVVVSTVLIVIFSEIIPQSLCTRYGLAIGAQMAWFVKILIIVLGIIAWPVAKLLEFILGKHHGIMYRRAELKELIALHSNEGQLGGDLKTDTVAIIGGALDLQEKVVRQAMTPIDDVFMLSIDAKLDHDTMQRICDTGHSRVPIYEEIDILATSETPRAVADGLPSKTRRVKKIIGILLVKQCLMLDPKDGTPLRSLPLHKVVFVPNNEPLLQMLDKFQEGRSHIAVVSRHSVEKALSVKAEVKKGLTKRLKERVGISDSSSSESSSDESEDETQEGTQEGGDKDGGSKVGKKMRKWRKRKAKKREAGESNNVDVEKGEEGNIPDEGKPKEQKGTWSRVTSIGREQALPDDAVLTKGDAKEFLQSFDPAVMPLGIITLEDVLEELIGEEIYDEFDPEIATHVSAYPSKRRASRNDHSTPTVVGGTANVIQQSPIVSSPQITPTSPQFGLPSSAPATPAEQHITPRAAALGTPLRVLANQRKIRSQVEHAQSDGNLQASMKRSRSKHRGGISVGASSSPRFSGSMPKQEQGDSPANATVQFADRERVRIPETMERVGPDIDFHETGEGQMNGLEGGVS